MSVIAVFIIFFLCMAPALILNISMTLPLFAGLLLFAAKAKTMGFSFIEIWEMMKPGVKDSLIVIRILLLIGCLTGLWRGCGTVAEFIVAGIGIMPPHMFILAAFLLSSLMAFALGTSFGVTATCGTILIAIAEAANANTLLVAAAVLSGVYVGDRGSPASSSGNLVAVLTGTDMRNNVRKMMRTAAVPYALCIVLYGLLSLLCPMGETNLTLLDSLQNVFRTGWICFVPALLMIILPFLRLPIKRCMWLSIASAFLITVLYQKTPVMDALKTALFGYNAADPVIGTAVSGGGVVSMLEVSVILLISGTYDGIFRRTGMLEPLTKKLSGLTEKIGRFGTMALLGLGCSAVFCNQTIGVIMQNQLSAGLYGDSEEERTSKMLDIEDSAIVLAAFVPWCIACSVPLAMMNADLKAVPLAFYVWLVPLCRLFSQKRETEKKRDD